MALLGIDIGGTKMAMAIFSETGEILFKKQVLGEGRGGHDAGKWITSNLAELAQTKDYGDVSAAGVCVPGIYRIKTGRVWAPNIPGWEDYPLLEEIKKVSGNIPVSIDSDRACYILGETWQGNTRNCKDAIYLAVGTGIGAGIMAGGTILRGSHDIAGAIGWMALQKPFLKDYINCGCFEEYSSGEGIVKTTRKILNEDAGYPGVLRNKPAERLTTRDVFDAFEKDDPCALKVIQCCIEFWGMAAANLVSLFNPEKIIFGGGVFGPAISLIPKIKEEAAKWAQPVSMKQVSFESSALGNDAGVYGAGYLAFKNIH